MNKVKRNQKVQKERVESHREKKGDLTDGEKWSNIQLCVVDVMLFGRTEG